MVLMSDEEVAGYGRNPDAGFGALQTARGPLPLVAMEVDARVSGVIASTEVVQRFVNPTAGALEATYIFPLPDRAAVHRFRMEVAGRVIEGVIDERAAARAQYDQAIATGHRAAIAEEERPGVFTLRVGNLMPGEAATVRLSLVGPLPVDDGEVTFRFPLVVAPRYIPGTALGGDQAGLGRAADTDLVPDASRISPPVLLPGSPNPVRLGLRVALEDGALRDVASSLHAVTVARRDAQVIEVQPGERLDRDFILRWRVDAGELTSSLVCADDPGGTGGTFALTVVPPSTQAVGARPRDVVFVIDRSGSMEGWKMVAARRAAARMIDTLTSRDRFCALAFDHVFAALPEARLVDATDRQRFRAVEALARVEARGGTEIAAPLARALAMLAGGTDDRERVIVLVTDGQVGNEDDVLRQVAPNLRNIKVFTLGIDQAVNAAFLRRLAAAGGGLCELVESEDRLDAVMAKVHRRIGTPIATELAVRATGLELERGTLAPGKLPDVYAGAPVVIFGRYLGAATPGAAIEVEGTSLGEPWQHAVALRSPAQASSWLAASWARAHLRDLEDRHAAGARELETRIVRVSKQFGVLSRFTAFVAVDRSAVANPGGGLRQIVQPVEQPAGWADDGAEGALLAGGPTSVPIRIQSFGTSRVRDRSEDAELVMSAAMASPVPLPPGAPPTVLGALPPMLAPAVSFGGPPLEPRDATVELDVSDAGLDALDPGLEFSAAVNAAHVRRLVALALDLEAQIAGGCDAAGVRLVRQRLTQWIEDLRSVGGSRELAAAVEALVRRLSDALAVAMNLAAELKAIADELARLATGALPSDAGSPGGPRPGRPAFWK
jgi:Ca-activated chloride channel family protein